MFKTATQEQVEERTFSVLVELGADPQQVSRDAELESIDIDSLDLVELAQIVEDEYGVQLKGEDLEGLRTVGEATDLVVSRLP
jgi:acyl carrier protein